jgi:glycosyltransferase involved in cell wall biosynthesis
MPNVLVVRGHQATPWELRPWTLLPERYGVSLLRTGANAYDTAGAGLDEIAVRTRRDRLPSGRVGDLLTRVAGDRFTGDTAAAAFAAADIVHAEELSYWFSADAARRKAEGGRFALVQTIWETLPLGRTYRNAQAKGWRDLVLAETDLFLAATERARDGLLLEGVPAEKIAINQAGVDLERFATSPVSAGEHVILSPGRLVWEKGHQDVLRAVAALHRGLVGEPVRPRVLIIGHGPEEARLRMYAEELGLGGFVEIRGVPYDEMPAAFARASAMVLASLPSATSQLHLFDLPRAFWEEQFGYVLAEAMAAGLDIVASDSGAIPEVLGGQGTLVAAGDWMGIARRLAAGPVSRPPGARVSYPAELLERYSVGAMARRLGDAYDALTSART